MPKIVSCSGLLLYCLFIFWLSSQPSLPTPIWFEHQDKLHHAGAYFILGVLLWLSLKHWLKRPIILASLSIILGGLYGLSDEWHQSFVYGRTASAADWLADIAGVILAVFFLHTLRNRRRI